MVRYQYHSTGALSVAIYDSFRWFTGRFHLLKINTKMCIRDSIKMSKSFLSDPRYKITDISAKVGYSDGNYYSKTFRKIVGLSPSEYREKMLP